MFRMACHNILSKTDRALVAFIIEQGAGTAADTFPAKRSQDKTLPCTICWSEKFEEAAPYSGTFIVRVSIMVRTLAALDAGQDPNAPKIASDARVQAVFDLFYSLVDSAGDKLGETITEAARTSVSGDNPGDLKDFTCLNAKVLGGEAAFDEKEHGAGWVDTLNLELVCCPANVS